ncbi:MAG: ankyrin repeat domain-containing protein [Alphaproteobacteria bacterium]
MKKSLPHSGDTALSRQIMIAAMLGDLEKVKQHVAAGGETGLIKADVSAFTVSLSLSDRVNMEFFSLLNMHGFDEALNAPMYMAAFKGHEAVVDYFIANGDYDQKTLDAALYAAAIKGSLPLVEKLCTAGADVRAAESRGLASCIMNGKPEIAQYLLLKGRDYTTALKAHALAGDMPKALEMMRQGGDVVEGLAGLCDDEVRNRSHHTTGIMPAFNALLQAAEDRGDDMQELIRKALPKASSGRSPDGVERLVTHPAFAGMADKKKLIDNALDRAGYLAFRGFNPVRYGDYAKLCCKLMDMGGDVNIGLMRGVEAGSLDLTQQALQRGADPRLNNRAVIKNAILSVAYARPSDPSHAILKLLCETETRLDTADVAAMGPLSVANLRAALPSGRSGFTAMAAAGEGAKAIAAFKAEKIPVTFTELTTANIFGETPLALICDKGGADALCDRDLWLMREEEYRQVFNRFPAALQEKLQMQNAETEKGLKAHRDVILLKEQAEAHKRRFRIK